MMATLIRICGRSVCIGHGSKKTFLNLLETVNRTGASQVARWGCEIEND